VPRAGLASDLEMAVEPWRWPWSRGRGAVEEVAIVEKLPCSVFL